MDAAGEAGEPSLLRPRTARQRWMLSGEVAEEPVEVGEEVAARVEAWVPRGGRGWWWWPHWPRQHPTEQADVVQPSHMRMGGVGEQPEEAEEEEVEAAAPAKTLAPGRRCMYL